MNELVQRKLGGVAMAQFGTRVAPRLSHAKN